MYCIWPISSQGTYLYPYYGKREFHLEHGFKAQKDHCNSGRDYHMVHRDLGEKWVRGRENKVCQWPMFRCLFNPGDESNLRMLEPWIKNPGGLDADNFIQSGSVVRGTYVYHRSYSIASKSCWGSFCDPYVYVVFKAVKGPQGLRTGAWEKLVMSSVYGVIS